MTVISNEILVFFYFIICWWYFGCLQCFGDIQKVRSLKIPKFWPPPPPLSLFFILARFRTPLPNKVRPFWLELTLSPSISILVKFRGKKLMSTSIFAWRHSGVSIKWKPLVNGKGVCFMEMSFLCIHRVHLRIRSLQK